MNMNQELIPRSTLAELCAAWKLSSEQIRTAFAAIIEAETRLTNIFGQGTRDISVQTHGRDLDFERPDDALQRMERQVWGTLVQRLELRKVLSLKRIEEMDQQIETGKGLPPLTYENVLAVLESNFASMEQYLEEKVREVYEWLRPKNRHGYKTVEKSLDAGVGRKIILTWMVTSSYRSNGGFEVGWGRGRDELRALDQVFHLLDGAPQAGDHDGEIVTAIVQQTSSQCDRFVTPYFKGRCFHNRNLHLEFLRLDLLEKFNLVAGGARLKDIPKSQPS